MQIATRFQAEDLPVAPPSHVDGAARGGAARSAAILARMNEAVIAQYAPHPFSHGVTRANVKELLGSFLAMSLAFPYLQAGAHHFLINDRIRRKSDVDAPLEATAVVAAFLTWDEFGGHAKILAKGMPGLVEILETHDFHANLLRDDIRALTGVEVAPNFSITTRAYLAALEDGLASIDPVDRIAHMVAFERHAGAMIEALWNSLRALFPSAGKLPYFETHVGGDDPAEAYHISMTALMIERGVDPGQDDRLVSAFEEAYKLHVDWCAAVKGCRGG